MTDFPINFTSAMVRDMMRGLDWATLPRQTNRLFSAPLAPGDRYWVREMIRHAQSGRSSWIYDSDKEPVEVPQTDVGDIIRWARAQKRARIPASHMPRMFSRFT